MPQLFIDYWIMVGQAALKAAKARKMALMKASRVSGGERDRSTPPTLGDGTRNLGDEVNPLAGGGALVLPPCPEAHPEGTGMSAGPSAVPASEATGDDVDVPTAVPAVEVVNPGPGGVDGAVEEAPIILDSSPEVAQRAGKRKLEESGGSHPKKKKSGLEGEGAGFGVLSDVEGANCIASFQAVAQMRLGGEDLAAFTSMKDFDAAFLKYVKAREKGEIYLLKVLDLANRANKKAEGAETVRMEMARRAEESEKRASALEKELLELKTQRIELEASLAKSRAECRDLKKQQEEELGVMQGKLAEVVNQERLAVRKMKSCAEELKASGPFLRAEVVRTALSGPAYEAYQASLIADQFGDGFGLAIDQICHAGGIRRGLSPLMWLTWARMHSLKSRLLKLKAGKDRPAVRRRMSFTPSSKSSKVCLSVRPWRCRLAPVLGSISMNWRLPSGMRSTCLTLRLILCVRQAILLLLPIPFLPPEKTSQIRGS